MQKKENDLGVRFGFPTCYILVPLPNSGAVEQFPLTDTPEIILVLL